jgi:Trk-type K+ transport system membrane component
LGGLRPCHGLISKYLLWHARRQIAFDAWPLPVAIFAICCIERDRILADAWFSLFRILFECTSAYALIGLSLGTPSANYSFCGEFSTASKIVVSVAASSR